ncbi:MAG: DNA replication and repair protein RecF [Saprospiraceae bacterium]|nr:DNA replication and repair protein RecF [Saprospiraceae bacterium]
MIKSLSIRNFKNYERLSAAFRPGINFFVGKNGVGKTNLLDAIHYLGVTRSFLTPQDKYNVRFDTDFFRMEALVGRAGHEQTIVAKVKPGQLKEFAVDGVKIERLGDHLGFLPVIVLAPQDQMLITGISADRRRFVDFYLCQTDPAYLGSLSLYNRLLNQRNAALKEGGWHVDRDLVMTYTDNMVEPVDRIAAAREAFVAALQPRVVHHYQQISDNEVDIRLTYRTTCRQADFRHRTEEAFDRDRALGRTTFGIHRDDILFDLGEQPVKRFGSQGQSKTYLIALHLALCDVLRARNQVPPVLLLDDIFDKLDDQRVRHLVDTLGRHDFGQVFITDARPARIEQVCTEIAAEARVMYLADNAIDDVRDYPDN